MTMRGRLSDLLGAAEHVEVSAREHGVTPARAIVLRAHAEECAAALRGRGASEESPACSFVVPGRIEVLGKHTDYAGGRSLLVAVERGFTVVATPRDDDEVRLMDPASGRAAAFRVQPELEPVEGWASYPATAARRLARNFPGACTGADIAFRSDIPIASGMSSGSALVVAVWHALAVINDVERRAEYRANIGSAEELAEYLSAVENGRDFRALRGREGVGTQGGSEDHTAMHCARAGAIVRYAYAPVRFEAELPIPRGHLFAVASSGVRAEKAAGARERYNRAASLMHAAASHWRAATGGGELTVGAALDADPGAAERLLAVLHESRDAHFPPDALVARVRHFIAEDREIVPAASEALLRGDVTAFGAEVDRSQALAERLLENQIAETIHLARSARSLGAAAASAFGAGFGGSVWALVREEGAAEFLERWRADYLSRFPRHAEASEFLLTPAGPPMLRLL